MINERIIRTLNFEEVDYPPIYDIVCNDEMIEYYGKGDIFKAIDNSLDAVGDIRLPQKEGTIEKDGFVIEQKRWTEWIKEKPFKTHEETKEWIKKEIRKYTKYNEESLQSETEKSIKKHQEQQKNLKHTHKILTIVSTGFQEVVYSIGLDFFIYMYADDSNLVSELLEVKKDFNLRKIKYLKNPDKFSPIIFIGEDIAHKNGPIFSPGFLEREFFPRLKGIVKALHNKKLKVMFHSDGNLFPVLDDLVNCGIDGLNPLEGMDLRKIREKYPNLFLAGGIDCSNLLPFGSPEDVKLAVKRAIKDAERGYFLGSTGELHSDIPLENIRIMIETCRKM